MFKQNILFLFVFFLLSFYSSRAYDDYSYKQCTQDCSHEKLIVIVIPSYNNKQWYKHNLESALSQNYSNFYVIYTDDCSPDGTGELVEQYLMENDSDQKVYLIKNTTRRGALHNLYTMIHTCPDGAIIATLDGDDWFPDNQ